MSTASKYKTLTVDKETVTDLWDLPFGGNPDEGVSIISDTIEGTRRWSTDHKLIVRIGAKVYQTSYSRGATEYQDETPWEHDTNVEFIEVVAVEKTIVVWEPIKNA